MMATIKAMVAGKLRQNDIPTDDEVREGVKQYLKAICLTFPGEDNSDKNPIGVEFAKLMFHTMFPSKEIQSQDIKGSDLHEQAVNKLIEKIMDERDDLCDCPHLRQHIVETITPTKSWCDLYDDISYKDTTPKTADGR